MNDQNGGQGQGPEKPRSPWTPGRWVAVTGEPVVFIASLQSWVAVHQVSHWAPGQWQLDAVGAHLFVGFGTDLDRLAFFINLTHQDRELLKNMKVSFADEEHAF
jgi:hypothetical protein